MKNITQQELQKHLNKCASLKAIRKQESLLKAEVEQLTNSLVERIKGGSSIKEGRLTAKLVPKNRKNKITNDLIKSVIGQNLFDTIDKLAGSSESEGLEISETLINS